MSLSKSGVDNHERPLGDVSLERFALTFGLAKYDMKVNVQLRYDITVRSPSIAIKLIYLLSSLSMNLVQPGMDDPIKFMSSTDAESSLDKDLLVVNYVRAQKESPEFVSRFEGIDQSVDVQISTFIFRAAPEPVLTLYDFIMTTFVPQSTTQTAVHQEKQSSDAVQSNASDSDSKIRVIVRLASVQGKQQSPFPIAYLSMFL